MTDQGSARLRGWMLASSSARGDKRRVEMQCPLLDLALADQFYLTKDEQEMAALRAMLAEFVADVSLRFAELHRQCHNAEANGEEVRRSLHGLRGVIGNYTFHRAADRLRVVELEWSALTGAEIIRGLRAAESDLRAGLNALSERYPYLGISPIADRT